ncbi:UDP-N-acetylglucosamine 2-epimerase [Candidatus Magnetaquicoccus inordinatus]|uniref:UDP-N-acetylglucosamine 2-epimerase n=1 Tax=Candidatus Magnetaquicoccus inordinatus TaxID=2496818 RepID=UPI00102D13EF|nr:UDP-N-acetylglucosamine 2-epimerase [Candidatus Magnetaquicoccus inordinatus]
MSTGTAEDGLLAECRGRIRVLALTGIRSEYDLLYPLLRALEDDPAFHLGVIVCGAHLTDRHHYSVRRIEEDGLPICERLETLLHSDSRVGKVRSSALLMSSLAQTLDRERPDLLLLLGDREEVVVGALSGLYLGIPVVHLAGGDSLYGGCPDEWVRHAASKMSHLHLVMTQAHAERLQRMGEELWRIHVVGSGGVDRLRQEPPLSVDELAAHLGEKVRAPFGIFLFHPLLDDHPLSPAAQVELCLQAVAQSGLHLFAGAPNSDPGAMEIAQVLQKAAERQAITLYRHLPRAVFVALLRHARCLLGNSSLAFHEAPFLGLPAVNIGNRQQGRLAAAQLQSVALDRQHIREAVERAAFDQQYRATIQAGDPLYGDGYMAERSLTILKSLPGKQRLLGKQMTY